MSRALLVAVVTLSACKSRELAPLYCEGGIANGKSNGGECLQITHEKIEGDPAAVGTATLVSRYKDRFTVRRVDATHYDLLLAGAREGSLTRDGEWLTVAIGASTWKLRGDAP